MTRTLTLVLALFALLVGGDAWAADVTLTTSDGVKIHATYNEVKGAKGGVVLTHMLKKGSSDWRYLADKINAAGLSTIAVDLRKQGANVPEGTTVEIADTEYPLMVNDVKAAVAFLKTKGLKEVALVGASIGANLSLAVAAADPTIKNVILLSPGMDYKGVAVTEPIAAYGARPLLVVVSKDDPYSAKTGLFLDSQAKGPHVLKIYDTAGHGTVMLNKAPDLESLIVSWLLGSYAISDSSGARTEEAIQTGPSGTVTTTGKRMGE